MDTLRDLSQRRGVVLAAAAVAGLVLGLVYAWAINPVEWTDASPELLREDYQVDYLKAAIDSYSVNRDVDVAVARYQALGAAGPAALAAIQASPGEVSPAAIEAYTATVTLYEPSPGSTPTGGGAAPATTSITSYLLPACGLTIVLGALLAAVVVIRNRASRRGAREPLADEFADAYEPEDAYAAPSAERAAPPPAAGLDRPPLATFRTTYTLGDDLYDDSFSIESAAGDFLGECGVGIGDLIGVGEPKKVSAFEVWLFDKNDIQTVTKVLMSRYAYQDEATRNRMAAKGDPLLAEPGAVVTLETASLIIEARIVDLTYGGGALPAESFFERMTVELRAASKLGVD
ncbi:MAG TPA: hypothetical protein VLL77_00645 [Anaerolineales bacterium]|nr:hypothetical protein [Anaerolineales bacterium]